MKKKLIVVMVLISALIYLGVDRNDVFYSEPIGKIIAIEETEISSTDDVHATGIQQKITVQLTNTKQKSATFVVINQSTVGQAFQERYMLNDHLFLKPIKMNNGKMVAVTISGLKRDRYMAYIGILFVLLTVFIGQKKGVMSLISVCVNALFFCLFILLYLKGYPLMLLAVIMSIALATTSIILVCGINRKSAAAIVSTLLCTTFSMGLMVAVMYFTGEKGLYFEEMEFMPHDPVNLYLVGVLIGTLGGVMDIAISMASALNEMRQTHTELPHATWVQSGFEVGKDIMGTMANTLVLAYMSGSIALMLIWFQNNVPFTYVLSHNLNLEVTRALTSSIGIVMSIPVSIFVSTFLLKKGSVS